LVSLSLLLRHGGLFFRSVCAENSHLQLLAADEVGPGANLGGDLAGAGQLLAHTLSEEGRSLENQLVIWIAYYVVTGGCLNIPWAP
jgi:hypothetical protein